MKYIKSAEPATIPFGIYRFNHDYINALKKTDNKVIDPEILDRYCGPVYQASCEKGLVEFFVPVSYEYETANCFALTFYDGVFAGIMDFKLMIPCVNEKLITPDKTNNDLMIFCSQAKCHLEQCADYIMKLKQSDIQ